jgi:hypothetical protein
VSVTRNPGITATFCTINPFGDRNETITDLVPVKISSVDVLELGQEFEVVSQNKITGPWVDNETFDFTSITAVEGYDGKAPKAIQLNLFGENELGEPILNYFAIEYSNSCNDYPTLIEGDSAGWTSFTTLAAPSRELCPAVTTESPTASPTVPKVEPTDPPVDPTEPPVEPTEAPVDPTDPPVDPTEPPVEPTEAPVDPTESPIDMSMSMVLSVENIAFMSMSMASSRIGIFRLADNVMHKSDKKEKSDKKDKSYKKEKSDKKEKSAKKEKSEKKKKSDKSTKKDKQRRLRVRPIYQTD